MERFLTDCTQQLLTTDPKDLNPPPEDIKSRDHAASRKGQDIQNQGDSLDLQNLTLEEAKTCFKDTNPFSDDVLEELFGGTSRNLSTDPFKEFQSFTLNVENFPNDAMLKGDEIDNEGKIN